MDLKIFILNSRLTLVGIHWRGGDFLRHDKLAYGHVVSQISYLKNAMNHFLDKYCDVLFILTSDDKEHYKNVFKNTSQI